MRGHVSGTQIKDLGRPYIVSARPVAGIWIGEAWSGIHRLLNVEAPTEDTALEAAEAELMRTVKQGIRIDGWIEIAPPPRGTCACDHGGTGCKNNGQNAFEWRCYFCREQPCAGNKPSVTPSVVVKP